MLPRVARSCPTPLNPSEKRSRQHRAAQIARALGFVGRVEYAHIYSQTGGAQYGQGSNVAQDVLIVYAEAFDRDADPDDFSLRAIIAHERGHQLLARHPRLSQRVEGIAIGTEEILASVLGAVLCGDDADGDSLISKAMLELLQHGESPDVAVRRLQSLSNLFKAAL